MKRVAPRLRVAVLPAVLVATAVAVCAWALWSMLQPDMVLQLTLLLPFC